MSTLELLRTGASTTLQDGGRVGSARWGVPRSGPVDALSHRLAARLAGVPVGEVESVAALEVGPHRCRFTARDGPLVVAVAGAAHLDVDGMTTTPPAVVRLATGATCTVQARTWAYVVPAGSVDVPSVLGSRSHHPRSGLGPGLTEQAPLGIGPQRDVVIGERRSPAVPSGPLGVLCAPHTHLFESEALTTLVGEQFRTTATFDRMGQRLDGPALHGVHSHDVVSDGIVPGSIQVPGDGRPFVLTADHQTTGGYPRIAVLGRVALARFVRLPPDTVLRFAWTDVAAARAQLVTAHAAIEACVDGAVSPNGSSLQSDNLVSGVTDGTHEE